MRSKLYILLRMRSFFHHWWKDIFSPDVHELHLKSWHSEKISFQPSFYFVYEFELGTCFLHEMSLSTASGLKVQFRGFRIGLQIFSIKMANVVILYNFMFFQTVSTKQSTKQNTKIAATVSPSVHYGQWWASYFYKVPELLYFSYL
jgi:hypothetical protein